MTPVQWLKKSKRGQPWTSQVFVMNSASVFSGIFPSLPPPLSCIWINLESQVAPFINESQHSLLVITMLRRQESTTHIYKWQSMKPEVIIPGHITPPKHLSTCLTLSVQTVPLKLMGLFLKSALKTSHLGSERPKDRTDKENCYFSNYISERLTFFLLLSQVYCINAYFHFPSEHMPFCVRTKKDKTILFPSPLTLKSVFSRLQISPQDPQT